jgi:hypothetical protein
LSRPRIPAPSSPFPSITTLPVAAGTPVYRIHSTSLRPAEFNPCRGQPSRFAPLRTAAGECIPSLYAAETRQAAAFESVFHDIKPAARFKTVPFSLLESRTVSEIVPRRGLHLVQLFAPDLKAWGIPRNRLIDTPKSTYRDTAAWAEAIHGAHLAVDGLVWTSRQCDPDICLVLFGDRISASEFDIVESRRVAGDAALLLELRAYGARAGITILS